MKKDKKLVNKTYKIENAFLASSIFGFTGTPSLSYYTNCVIDTERIRTDVSSAPVSDDGAHMVRISIQLETLNDVKDVVHVMSIVYMAFVRFYDENLTEEEIHDVLYTAVPRQLFDDVSSFVMDTAKRSGFPVKLGKKTYMGSIHDMGVVDIHEDEDDMDDDDEFDDEFIDFQYILEKLSAQEEVADFLNAYKKLVGEDVTNSFDEMPAYSYYYKFFIPIEYNHPDYDNCDDDLWPMLFQLLFGNFNATCNIVDMGDEYPDIRFTYEEYQDKLISELTLDELKDLMEELVSDMLTDVTIVMLDYQYVGTEYCKNIDVYRLVRKNEFLKIFGQDNMISLNKDELEFIEKMYSRIKDCDIKTLIYRK